MKFKLDDSLNIAMFYGSPNFELVSEELLVEDLLGDEEVVKNKF